MCKRDVMLRARARQFAKSVKGTNAAHRVPDDVLDWLKNSEMERFFALLRLFGLTMRSDYLWEERKWGANTLQAPTTPYSYTLQRSLYKTCT